MEKFEDKLKNLLKKDLRFVDEESGELIRSEIVNESLKIDKKLIESLLSDKEIKSKFFTEIKGHWIFEINKFIDFIQDKNFLSDSYTKFKNKIGLNLNGKFLNERKEVALVWPFKDCVLEGGMTKEDEKRNEIFFNEILAQDEIDRLLDSKVLTNFKRYTAKGEEKVNDFKRDKEGTIKDNLIIKGNNLLALHSLKKEFQRKVKLIYIDPPFNRDADVFYNDNFKRSTWLTFMKNRLDVARSLLLEEGVIFVHIDNNELAYLKVLMDEVFLPDNFLQIISVKKATTAGFKSINLCPTTVTEYILMYSKNKNMFNSKPYYVEVDYDEDYGKVIKNPKDNPEKWKLISLDEVVIKQTPFSDWKEAKEKWGPMWKDIRKGLKAAYAFENKEVVVSTKDLHKPSDEIKKLMEKSKIERDKVFVHKRKENGDIYAINGRIIAFYSGKFRKINGEEKPAELLTNFWDDISWYGIANEGGVTLKNSKKPEKLLHRIIELITDKEDIVLDYHLGSGTTCAVAHKMGLQYIGIEQMDYKDNDSITRLKNVINGDSTGISDLVNWKGGGEFVYCELMKFNEEAVEKIQDAKNTEGLLKIWKEMVEHYFLNYDVSIKKFNDNQEEFKKLSLEKQKKLLVEMLNKNQLYVNLSEIDDAQSKVSKEDKELNKKFYK